MATEMRQEKTDLHGSVQVRRKRDRRPEPLARERGHQIPLFGPADGSALDVHLIELDPGGPPGHYHTHTTSDNVYVVLRGSVDVRHADGVTRLNAGDAIRFPPGAPHSATIVGSRRAVLLEVYSPAPVDFVLVEESTHSSRRS